MCEEKSDPQFSGIWGIVVLDDARRVYGFVSADWMLDISFVKVEVPPTEKWDGFTEWFQTVRVEKITQTSEEIVNALLTEKQPPTPLTSIEEETVRRILGERTETSKPADDGSDLPW